MDMDTRYDCKFEEMKKYIPFLENMITRLESTTTSSSNPRQAQLDKIRSLRDLLSNKKKRMKMENLLKCEQVLVNLYAKVEQRDTLSSVSVAKNTTDSGFSIDSPTPKEKSDLEAVRNKLKTVVKRQENMENTLPEILARSEINDVHTSGTKEPALFQRRPNQQHNLPINDDHKRSPPGSASKRNYTRVLVSPETSSRRWPSTDSTSAKPLFCRRSPRKSPRRYSPSYYKRERKKSNYQSNKQTRRQKDLNITLNVPKESLNSLNTRDILSRIINCSDSDVDIDTLRELRKQILGELKKTGARDDISDLILKSYDKNNKCKDKDKEVEEGELSDSESEAIESIYGSLIVKEPGLAKASSNKDSQPRKIQIRLVIDSDENTEPKVNTVPKQELDADFAELEMYEKGEKNCNPIKTTVITDDDKPANIISTNDDKTTVTDSKNDCSVTESHKNTKDNPKVPIPSDNITPKTKETAIIEQVITPLQLNETVTSETNISSEENIATSKEDIQFKANFYKPLTDQSNSELIKELVNKEDVKSLSKTETASSTNMIDIESTVKEIDKPAEIPLLHERTIENKPPESTLSEIDILQALKKEILSEIPVPGTEATTPALHQPKVIKVASAQELLPKKRISIEKYKEKSVNSSKLYVDKVSPKDDLLKKTSLKLTDKECERFFSVPKISFDEEDESLDDDDDDDIQTSDIYGDLAPKSPDHNDSNNAACVPPVIIPVDPVKTTPASCKADVDMRTLQLLSPNENNTSSIYNNISTQNDLILEKKRPENNTDEINNHNRPVLVDPRVRDLNTSVTHQSPSPRAVNPERTPRPLYATSSASTPHRIMTPNARTYEMTPTHQSFEVDQLSRKHVYVPTLSYYDISERENSMTKDVRSREDTDAEKKSRVNDGTDNYRNLQRENLSQHKSFGDPISNDVHSKGLHNDRHSLDNRDDSYNRSDSNFGKANMSVPSTQTFTRLDIPISPNPSFARSDGPTTTTHTYGRLECPPTPTHAFGRLDCPPTANHHLRMTCPSTPNHSFERVDCPPTPGHSFGRGDCQLTPNHPFGRGDCPPTPSHSFGRIDCPTTPSHHFGRTECPSTPTHSFGRGDGALLPTPTFERTDCPATPSHSFGKNEGPSPLMLNLTECPTPSNIYTGNDCSPTPLFGRNDCPPTPSRLFSPSDCAPSPSHPYSYHEPSQTPNHHFGRPTKNQYSRADFTVQKYNKDPRLNRKSESKPQFDEQDHSFYKDRDRYRGSSYSSQKMYSGSDTYPNFDREQNAGRNKYKYYAPESHGRHYNKEQRHERSMGHSLSNESESEKSGNRDHRHNNDTRYSEEKSRREYYRETAAGRNAQREDNSLATRSSSIGRNNTRDHHKLSVAFNSGRSFTIDTSINATFQKIIDSAKEIQGFVNSFDARRQRAASVGRSLVREASVGRTLKQPTNSKSSKHEDTRQSFRRASSVGRELYDKSDKRSFQEIKADFKIYNSSVEQSTDSKKPEFSKAYNRTDCENYTGRSRKDIYEKAKNEKYVQESKTSTYSPRKNYRDPRMRRQFDKKYDKYSPDTPGRRSGIIYSNNNIVTGSILTSGYGVKNYKIPKIKRVTEDNVVAVENVDSVVKKDKTITDKTTLNRTSNKDMQTRKVVDKPQKNKPNSNDVAKEVDLGGTTTEQNKKVVEVGDEPNEESNRRVTRSRKLNLVESKINIDTEITKPSKTKKHRKLVYDSESDKDVDGEETKENMNLKDDKSNSANKTLEHTSPNKQKHCEKLDPTDLDSSFGIDELEMFTDNTALDPVIDNINDLIADLDNDLNRSKNDTSHNFTKEISVENMMQNISSPEKHKNSCNDDSEEILKGKNIDEQIDSIVDKIKDKIHSEVLLESSKDSQKQLFNSVTPELQLEKDKGQNYLEGPVQNLSSEIDVTQKEDNENFSKITSTSPVKCVTDHIDSTTEVEKYVNRVEGKPQLTEQNIEGCSTPDSTINTDDVLQKSSDEENLSANIHEVTSTEIIEPKPSLSAEKTGPALDSIGSFLSILQDKSKIKELLTLLDDKSSENEKIKKKLEKLSEIVSDDEETCNEPADNKFEQNAFVDSENMIKQDTLDQKNIDIVKDSLLNVNINSTVDAENESKPENSDLKSYTDVEMPDKDTERPKEDIKANNKQPKKPKTTKKIKRKQKKYSSVVEKRVTRSNAPEIKQKVKKPPRELMQLQEDIKEMFMRDDVLSATGIRMCRLAKLVDANTSNTKEDLVLSDTGPVVVLEKYRNSKVRDIEKVNKKKLAPKINVKTLHDNAFDSGDKNNELTATKYKAGPKSKTKNKKDSDPYAFETDSVGDTNTEKASEDGSGDSSDSECDSLVSCKSFGSTELDVKKKIKRKRRGWQDGVIKPKNKKKKVEIKDSLPKTVDALVTNKVQTPDINCFTDRSYCFRKNQLRYSCRFCIYAGDDIVLHYRNQHPHIEVPLSRMAPDVAKEAIEQCEEINFKAISKISSDKYVCIFCFKEFTNCKSVLETLFWHIVSTHTGEFKQNCLQCENVIECPFKLHIPPPPENNTRQLIGYMCKKCNFTQISLENLKTHVIMRHDDNQTAVYTINLSFMSKKALKSLLRRSDPELASQSSVHSFDQLESETTDHLNESLEGDFESEGVRTRKSIRQAKLSLTPPIQSKITFEADDNISELSDLVSEADEINIKAETIETYNADGICEDYPDKDFSEFGSISNLKQTESWKASISNDVSIKPPESLELQPCADISNFPHFKINFTESGTKEYFCCIKGLYHFKTTLLISMKKHVQSKHSENWDGYCYVCKVIVTPQGMHKFRDCLEHYLDKHMDNFPIFEKEYIQPVLSEPFNKNSESSIEEPLPCKPKINVRPLSELTVGKEISSKESVSLPVIQNVMSLGVPPPESSLSSNCSVITPEVAPKIFKYEEHQEEVILKKYYLVVQAMISPDNLIKVFKCSGRYCSYATDCTREALAHATTHQRVGGTDALNCSYCNFDSGQNAVDLVMHVFKIHGCCRYCCQQCFYRAASSQAVASHILRIHKVDPLPGSVLRTTAVLPIPVMKYTILTREEAVLYYNCGHDDGDTPCKFRTFTPDKFCEHLDQRHADALEHPCHTCSLKLPKTADLIQHMKDHGIRLYQCTWCVYGADNERGLLDHISIMHPDKPPQAYIRIITNKEGSAEKRVLPLAFLTKHKIATKDLTPIATKEDPEREAKRSIEMEALIAPFITEAHETPADTFNTATLETADAIETPVQLAEFSTHMVDTKTSVVTKSPEVTQIESDAQLNRQISMESSEPLQPVAIKTELPDTQTVGFGEIVILDSDDESSTSAIVQPVIDLSDDEASISKPERQNHLMIPMKDLYKCPHCRQVCKSIGGLKKHMFNSHTNISEIKCPHCMILIENVDKLMLHYNTLHSITKTLECELCGKVFVTEANAKKHLRSIHKLVTMSITKSEKDGLPYLLVNGQQKPLVETGKEKIAPKRKLSGSKSDTLPFKRRFEPQEIDQLPITPILDQLVYCSRCEFSTKVRLNMVRHLQLHAEQQPVPQTVPVNPVPHLESNEKHFDKMVNLASSSVVNRTPDKPRQEVTPSVNLLIPPEAATRYPKFVPERQRHTCGAKGCSYISVDEAMLRRHWDTLHSGTSDFHCVHCPPHQHLDTSKPLTATRVISHLKMHDTTLYACSACSYYHFKREAVEKHLSEIHKDGRLMIVREEANTADTLVPVQGSPAPTMDLKPWQCGLCKFKTMLHPEVVDHCFKIHQSKMQFKCAYCPFRTSAVENVSKHQKNSHVGKPEDIFYYFYREGSIPDEFDGTPRWVKQRQKEGPSEPQVKVEVACPDTTDPKTLPAPVVAPMSVDLNLVKKEVSEVVITENKSIDDLCKIFGSFCEPNGIKFKCPLCTVVMEDTREGMQSHLYEELNYRKWSCGLCSYKAFHKMGLTEHMTTEHHRQYDLIELPIDANIEKWVKGVLDHQANIIDKYKNNLMKQKIAIAPNPSKPGPSTEAVAPKVTVATYSDEALEKAFGTYGHHKDSMFCCPRCGFLAKDSEVIRDHLETELNKIRWLCSNCSDVFQTYHEARFHSKGHDGPSRPMEAIRDPSMRAAWVTTVIEKQKKEIQTNVSSEPSTPEKQMLYSSDSENSLLTVLYEKSVPTDEMSRKRPAPDSDDEKLVIDEGRSKRNTDKQCPYCNYKSNTNYSVKIHMLTSHFNLKQNSCGHCDFTASAKNSIIKHCQQVHSHLPVSLKKTELPSHAKKIIGADSPNQISLVRQKGEVTATNVTPVNVLKCNKCSNLCVDVKAVQEHYRIAHSSDVISYTAYKLGADLIYYECAYCSDRFVDLNEYKSHHEAIHGNLPFKIGSESLRPHMNSQVGSSVGNVRRCARKSTTKLPNSVAKKSTTKLPYNVPDADHEYSYYGTKSPPLEQFSNVTTLMSFCNRLMPFTMKQLSEHLNIEPVVKVSDIKNSNL